MGYTRNMRMRVAILGVLFGLLMPAVGIFVGLQVSTTLGNVLAFPVIAVVSITGVPFGMWSAWHILIAALLSICIWTVIFSLLDKLLRG